MRLRTRRALATTVAVLGPAIIGGLLLLRGPHDVVLDLVAPEPACSSGLWVTVSRGADEMMTRENIVWEVEAAVPDGRVRGKRLSMRLPRGTYRVRAFYDSILLHAPPPLDTVIEVTESGTITLPLAAHHARCPTTTAEPDRLGE